MNFHLFTPTRLIFGAGKLNELGNQTMPGRKALLLISNGKSARQNGSLDRTLERLRKDGTEAVICGNVHENPSKEVIAACPASRWAIMALSRESL